MKDTSKEIRYASPPLPKPVWSPHHIFGDLTPEEIETAFKPCELQLVRIMRGKHGPISVERTAIEMTTTIAGLETVMAGIVRKAKALSEAAPGTRTILIQKFAAEPDVTLPLPEGILSGATRQLIENPPLLAQPEVNKTAPILSHAKNPRAKTRFETLADLGDISTAELSRFSNRPDLLALIDRCGSVKRKQATPEAMAKSLQTTPDEINRMFGEIKAEFRTRRTAGAEAQR